MPYLTNEWAPEAWAYILTHWPYLNRSIAAGQTRHFITHTCDQGPSSCDYAERTLTEGKLPSFWNPADRGRVVGHLQWNGLSKKKAAPGRRASNAVSCTPVDARGQRWTRCSAPAAPRRTCRRSHRPARRRGRHGCTRHLCRRSSKLGDAGGDAGGRLRRRWRERQSGLGERRHQPALSAAPFWPERDPSGEAVQGQRGVVSVCVRSEGARRGGARARCRPDTSLLLPQTARRYGCSWRRSRFRTAWRR